VIVIFQAHQVKTLIPIPTFQIPSLLIFLDVLFRMRYVYRYWQDARIRVRVLVLGNIVCV
jgi:hypothetical protein